MAVQVMMHMVFNVTEVGPVYETDDPEQFLHYLRELTPVGGGDEPEMCFTAIQVTTETHLNTAVHPKCCLIEHFNT